ncbi:MAG: transporter substrate-binding domain-containing protein [Candidatus Omnitrophota bacterium]
MKKILHCNNSRSDRHQKKLSGFLSVIFVLAISSLCLFNASLKAAENRKTLTFAGADKFPPYSYKVDSTPFGYFTDLTKLIFSETDYQINIKLMPWEHCFSGFRTGKIDGLIGVPFDEKSNMPMSFSSLIHEVPFAIFVNEDNDHVTSMRSLEGTVVGVRRWSPITPDLDKYDTIKLVKTESVLETLKKLKNREVTAIIVEKNTALYYISKYSIEDIKIVENVAIKQYPYAFAVKRDNKELLEVLDKNIKRVQDTTALEILENRWFGMPDSRSFPWKTVILITSISSGAMLLLSGILWVVFLNITVRSKTRQIRKMHQKIVEKDKLAVLGKLAGQIAHELRTPLSIIHNSVYLLEKEGPENRDLFKKRLQVLEDKVKLCGNILESILSYSRVKAEILEPVSVKHTVEEVLHDLEIPKKMRTNISFREEVPLTVFMDTHQLYSVIRNLLLNSIQAMDSNGTLSIDVGPSDKGQMITIRVSDTGRGILESARNKIFNLFYSSTITGTGLGLPISKSIIEANNGQLYLSETSDKGSSFIIKLPIAKGKNV